MDMGLFDLLKPSGEEAERVASALDAARDNAPDDSAIGRLVQMLLSTGLDGRGPLRAAPAIADAARRRTSDPEEAVERIFSRLGRAVPFLGGVIGAIVDGWMMRRIAEQAMVEFPAAEAGGVR